MRRLQVGQDHAARGAKQDPRGDPYMGGTGTRVFIISLYGYGW